MTAPLVAAKCVSTKYFYWVEGKYLKWIFALSSPFTFYPRTHRFRWDFFGGENNFFGDLSRFFLVSLLDENDVYNAATSWDTYAMDPRRPQGILSGA